MKQPKLTTKTKDKEMKLSKHASKKMTSTGRRKIKEQKSREI